MDNLQQKILEIFAEFRTPVNGVLKLQSIESKITKWDRRSQDNSQQALNSLISDGYIIDTKDYWLRLTQKGYDFLNQGYSILDTEEVILDFLKMRSLKTGHVIMENWLTNLTTKLERFHFDNFHEALQNIVDKGYIELRHNGMFLTQKGYDKIY